MESRLIFIDGISGSGKTSTGQFLYRQCLLNGLDATFLHEFHIPHPIHEWSLTDPEEWIDVTLDHWKMFVDKMLGSENIVIMDSTLFQGTMAVLLELDVDRDTILNYAVQVPGIIKPLKPALIYFYQNDYKEALLRIYHEREERIKIKKDNYVRTIKYGQNRQLYGHEGYMQFVEELRDISNELVSKYDIPRICIENSQGDWDDYHKRILEFLSLPYMEDVVEAGEYVGLYRDSQSGQECHIRSDSDEELEIRGFFPVTKFLCPRSIDTFFIRGKAHELIFKRDGSGVVKNMISRWYIKESDETIWAKIE